MSSNLRKNPIITVRLMAVICLMQVSTGVPALAQRADCSGGGPYSPTAITNMYNSSNNKQENATIWVEVAAATGNSSGAWGAEIIGLYYRPLGSGTWGPNLVDDWDTGRNVGSAVYNGPPSAYDWADSCHSYWDWNPTQGGNRSGQGSPSWVTGKGLSPVPWISTHTHVRDWASSYSDCLAVNQTIWMYPSHVEVKQTFVHENTCTKPGGYHPTIQQETPLVYLYPGETASDPAGFTDEVTYNGTNQWNPDYVNDAPSHNLVAQPIGVLAHSDWYVYSTENWLGMFRHSDGIGVTLACPSRPYHQPWPHVFLFAVTNGSSGLPNLQAMWARPFFDVNPKSSGEDITLNYYLIPGSAYLGRDTTYCLVPHRRWEFNHGQAHEGWINGNQVSNLRVVSGRLTGTSTGTDPYIISLDQLDFASDSFSGITVNMSLPEGTGSQAAIYYMTEEDPTWNEAKKKAFDTVPDGTFHTYYVTLSDVPNWAGKTIKRLRLDPTTTTTATDGIKIDYMKLWDSYNWEFNANGNNEGWTAATSRVSDPVWPNHVTGGSLVFNTERTDAQGGHPVVYGPYPCEIVSTGYPRYLQMRLRFTPAADENTNPFNAYLKYTLTTDARLVPSGIDRFDYAGHSSIAVTSIPADSQWHTVTFSLPTNGTIDQFRLEPTGIPPQVGKRGRLDIDYIRLIYS